MEKREFNKKEFSLWFEKLENVAKDEYRIGNLKKQWFEESYRNGLDIKQSIEKFLYEN